MAEMLWAQVKSTRNELNIKLKNLENQLSEEEVLPPMGQEVNYGM